MNFKTGTQNWLLALNIYKARYDDQTIFCFGTVLIPQVAKQMTRPGGRPVSRTIETSGQQVTLLHCLTHVVHFHPKHNENETKRPYLYRHVHDAHMRESQRPKSRTIESSGLGMARNDNTNGSDMDEAREVCAMRVRAVRVCACIRLSRNGCMCQCARALHKRCVHLCAGAQMRTVDGYVRMLTTHPSG